MSIIQHFQDRGIQHVPSEPVLPINLKPFYRVHTLFTTQLDHLVNRVQRLLVKRCHLRLVHPLSPELRLELIIVLIARATNFLKDIIYLVRICQRQRTTVLERQTIFLQLDLGQIQIIKIQSRDLSQQGYPVLFRQGEKRGVNHQLIIFDLNIHHDRTVRNIKFCSLSVPVFFAKLVVHVIQQSVKRL